MSKRTTSAALRAVLYGRVSQVAERGQPGKSVDDQLAENRSWACREDWKVVGEHRDDGISASRYARGKVRPGWTQVMELIAAGGVDLLVVWEVSRASRDRPVWTALLAACLEHGVRIATGGRLHDPADADDGFSLDLAAALAVRESAATSKRVLRAVRSRAQSGAPHGKVAYGYRIEYDPDTGRAVRRIPDETTAPVVREIVRRTLAGEALYSIVADLNARNVPPPRGGARWQDTQVKRIAVNPTIAGIRTHNGVESEARGGWESIISEADHRTLVTRLGDPARKTWRDGSVKHLLVGIAVCGARIPAELADAIRRRATKASNGWVATFDNSADEDGLVECGSPVRRIKNRATPSYTCAAGFHVARHQGKTDDLVERIVVARLSRPDAAEALSRPEVDGAVAEAAEVARTLRARLAALYDSAADGSLSPAGLARVESRLLPQIAEAERLSRPTGLPHSLRDVAGPDAQTRWYSLSMPQRRELVRVLVVPVIHPAGKGSRTFDPELIELRWR